MPAVTRPRCCGTSARPRRSAPPLQTVGHRDAATLSGGEQKRLVLEALLLGRDDLLLLDEPDNYLDVPGKEWLEERLRATPKTVLYVSHDRELLARTADRVVTVEGRSAWTHGGVLRHLPRRPRGAPRAAGGDVAPLDRGA